MTIDLDALDSTQLQEIKGQIDAVIAKKQRQEISKLRAEVIELVTSRGYTLQQILKPAADTIKAKRDQTYVHPTDPTKLWKGRGIKPKWLVEYVLNGGDIEDLEEKSAPKTKTKAKA